MVPTDIFLGRLDKDAAASFMATAVFFPAVDIAPTIAFFFFAAPFATGETNSLIPAAFAAFAVFLILAEASLFPRLAAAMSTR